MRQSVEAYIGQTYPNRELIIVANGDGTALAAVGGLVETLGRSDIRIIDIPTPHSLGALRNISLDQARGEVICQWDDDDLIHPRRLEMQMNALLEGGGLCMFLSEFMLFFKSSRTLHWLNFAGTPTRAAPGTLMCWKTAKIRYPEFGDVSLRGEDTAVTEQLQRQDGFKGLAGAAHLYIYVIHGANTWPSEFHQMLVDKLSISKRLLQRREAQLRTDLAVIDFGPGPIDIMGWNGLAFTLNV
jgi:glycosyltransferase involved in cell wall biosynthesis